MRVTRGIFSSAGQHDTGERGVTLVEALMVLGIATALISGTVALYGQASSGTRHKNAAIQMYGAIVHVRGRFGTTGSYGNSGRFSLISVQDDTFKNPYGGEIVAFGECTGSDCPEFNLVLNNIPNEACNALRHIFGGDSDMTVIHYAASVTFTDNTAWPGGRRIDYINLNQYPAANAQPNPTTACMSANNVNVMYVRTN